jgi:hypothetical protein
MGMKYKPEDYIGSGFYSGDENIRNHKEKLVKCRKPHMCVSCRKQIPKGTYILRETCFTDDGPATIYTCTDCIDEWLDEVNNVVDGERQ